MKIDRFHQINENFEPIYEFVTEVKVSLYGLPKEVDSDESTGRVYWKLRPIIKSNRFEFQVWLEKVEIESTWIIVDEEGDFKEEIEKNFSYSAEDVRKGEPESEDLGFTIMPVEVDMTLMPGGKDVVTIDWN